MEDDVLDDQSDWLAPSDFLEVDPDSPITETTVADWKRICLSKKDLVSKDNSHFWRGGVAHLPYSVDWTIKLKESIRDRDKHLCKMCGIMEEQCSRKLHVHHIDYDKKNCDPRNLISLCGSCHAKTTHGDRERWKNFFSK